MGRFPLFTFDISDPSFPSPSMPTALRQFEIITSRGETPLNLEFANGSEQGISQRTPKEWDKITGHC